MKILLCFWEYSRWKGETPWTPLIFSQINCSHSLSLCFEETQNSFARTHTDIVSTHTSGSGLLSFMSASSSPHPSVFTTVLHIFSILPPMMFLTWLCPKQKQIIKAGGKKNKMQSIVMFVCFHPGQQFRYSKRLGAILWHFIENTAKKRKLLTQICICEHNTCTVKDNCSALGKGWMCVRALTDARACVSVCLPVCCVTADLAEED